MLATMSYPHPTDQPASHPGSAHDSSPVTGGEAAEGVVLFHLQGSALTSKMMAPQVSVNGHPTEVHYGENAWLVPAGQIQIEAHTQWIRDFGHASIDLVVTPNEAVDVWYAAPAHPFSHGSLGLERQAPAGKRAVLTTLLVAALVFVLLVILFNL